MSISCKFFYILFVDPHIKVQGDPENVKQAKEKIMAVLDTKVCIHIKYIIRSNHRLSINTRLSIPTTLWAQIIEVLPIGVTSMAQVNQISSLA